MTTLSFSIPVPPSANNLFVNVPGKGRVKSAEYRAWISEAGWLAKSSAAGKVAPSPPYIVSCLAPTDRRRDLDNYWKATLDLMVRVGLLANDSMIDDLHIKRSERKDMLVTIGTVT